MTLLSIADLGGRDLPPWGCQRCQRVAVAQTREGGGVVTRWTCLDGLHMQPACTGRVPTKFNERKEPPPCSDI